MVLCCDPKAFTHDNPLEGMAEGGAFIWESDEEPKDAWERTTDLGALREILERNIRMFTLPGFDIARQATNRPDLQLRMQGNAFLGGFFRVSTLARGLRHRAASSSRRSFSPSTRSKFGKFGDAVVESNMQVMTQGISRVREIPVRRTRRRRPVLACAVCRSCTLGAFHERPFFRVRHLPLPRDSRRAGTSHAGQPAASFDNEFRSDYGYDQPASPLAAMGVMAAGSGDTASKYVARSETPLFIPENCTQCMECISVCPDTALPNCSAGNGDTILRTAIQNYVSDESERGKMLSTLPEMERRTREAMEGGRRREGATPLQGDHPRRHQQRERLFRGGQGGVLQAIIEKQPLAYSKTNAIFKSAERKNPGAGGIFSIFVSDLCKGCAACVTACGDHDALRMVQETEDVNADHETGARHSSTCCPTPRRSSSASTTTRPRPIRSPAALRNHLMVRRNYDALVSGDGACAGCGEKSVLRAIASA